MKMLSTIKSLEHYSDENASDVKKKKTLCKFKNKIKYLFFHHC
jgi:hypothetical protein